MTKKDYKKPEVVKIKMTGESILAGSGPVQVKNAFNNNDEEEWD